MICGWFVLRSILGVRHRSSFPFRFSRGGVVGWSGRRGGGWRSLPNSIDLIDEILSSFCKGPKKWQKIPGARCHHSARSTTTEPALSSSSTLPYRTAVVTGASSGIGHATVEKLAAAGVEVHAIARRADRLKELSRRTGCIAHAVDVTNLESCRRALDGLEVDVLVNNAGVSHNDRLYDFPVEKIDQIIDLNLRAVLHLTRFVLPGMMARNNGHVVIVSSMAGHYPMLGSAPYSATKAAVSQFLDVMRLDTNGSRIRWTEIMPGRVATEVFEIAMGGDRKAAQEKFLDGKDPLQAGDLADMIMFALSAPAHVNISRIDAYPTRQASGGFVYAG